jgi:hypothetical protein
VNLRKHKKITTFLGCLLASVACSHLPPLPSQILTDLEKSEFLRLQAETVLEGETHQKVPQVLWSHGMLGGVSSLKVSEDGSSVWVATSPDSDVPQSVKYPTLSAYDSKGVLKWSERAKYPIKDLDLSADGTLAVAATYGGDLIGMDSDGRTLWTTHGVCRPIIINSNKNIICYHDDDAEPEIAFELFDRNGKKLAFYPVSGKDDILILKLSQDQKNIVLGFASGQVAYLKILPETVGQFSSQPLLQPLFQEVWRANLKTDALIDLAISSHEVEPKVAVLWRDQSGAGGKEKVSILGAEGKVVATHALSFPAHQIEVSRDGEAIFSYGNSVKGQILARLSSQNLNEAWRKTNAVFADFPSSLFIEENGSRKKVWIGTSVDLDAQGGARLMSYDFSGAQVDRLTPRAALWSSIFAYQILSNGTAVVGTDDGRLGVYSTMK